MTKDIIKIQEQLTDISTDSLADVLCEIIFNQFDAYQAAKELEALLSNIESAHEFDIADRAVIAITGYSISSILEKLETRNTIEEVPEITWISLEKETHNEG